MRESQERTRPLWQWVLLAVAPGLVSTALGATCLLAKKFKLQTLGDFSEALLMATPLLGFLYLVLLSSSYVAAGMGRSRFGFVIVFGLLNTLLWGAGCSMQLSTISLNFH